MVGLNLVGQEVGFGSGSVYSVSDVAFYVVHVLFVSVALIFFACMLDVITHFLMSA